MYPKLYLEAFREFERTNEVFVAMPIDSACKARWAKVFKPAIKSTGLKPYRVDTRTVSDSILTDILAGIARARLVLVDVSLQQRGDGFVGPNPNVMYELGIAEATRLPEEVVVVRDAASTDPAPFDIAHIRYCKVDMGKEVPAMRTIGRLLTASLHAIDTVKDVMVSRTLGSLDQDAMEFLGIIGGMEWFDLAPFDPSRKGLYGLPNRDCTNRELRMIARYMINIGLLRAGDPGPREKRFYGGTPEYWVTDFGRVVFRALPEWARGDD